VAEASFKLLPKSLNPQLIKSKIVGPEGLGKKKFKIETQSIKI
jgi:hypothetical protein